MSNTKKVKEENHDPEVAIESAINKTEDFFQRNVKSLSTIVIAIVVVACGYFGWKYLYALPRTEKAADMMYVAERLFADEKWQLALEGDGNNTGFLQLIDKYGSTPQGNIARQYAGICYIKLDKTDEALEMLSKYSTSKGTPNTIVNAQNYGLRGDIYVQKEQYKEALDMFRKAIDAASNPTITPYLLKKAGLVCEKTGDNTGALSFYERIRFEFGASMEARDIEKSIGRVKQLQ